MRWGGGCVVSSLSDRNPCLFFFLSADHLHKRQRLLTKFRPLVSQRGVDVLKIGPPCRFSFGQIFALSRSESLAVVSYLPFPCYELLTLFLCSTCLQLKWGFYLLPAHHFRRTKRLLERCLFFCFFLGGKWGRAASHIDPSLIGFSKFQLWFHLKKFKFKEWGFRPPGEATSFRSQKRLPSIPESN